MTNGNCFAALRWPRFRKTAVGTPCLCAVSLHHILRLLVLLRKPFHAMIKNYLLFYVVDENSKTVTVIRFLHGRRNWKSILTM